jgi:hypothetical protein
MKIAFIVHTSARLAHSHLLNVILELIRRGRGVHVVSSTRSGEKLLTEYVHSVALDGRVRYFEDHVDDDDSLDWIQRYKAWSGREEEVCRNIARLMVNEAVGEGINGRLVETGRIERIPRALHEWVADHRRRCAWRIAARQKVEKVFGPSKNVERLERVLQMGIRCG